MKDWKRIDNNGYYAIVIYTFKPDEKNKLCVNVGECLHLIFETTDWFYGYVIKDDGLKGIIPKNYVKTIACQVKPSNLELGEPTTTFLFPNEPVIVTEITQVLREWSTLWKQLYVLKRKEFDDLRKLIWELINCRGQIKSGTLPVDELKKVTKIATTYIAAGNKILGLDLVVRDQSGTIINSDNTSTIQLYNYHVNAAESTKNNKTDSKEFSSSVIQQYSHIFILSVKNFTYKMTEDAELLIFLYDAKENLPITESYVVQWSKDGLMSDLDKINNLRVMFTDLGRKDLERERIYLVCNVVRVGLMETKEVDHRRNSSLSNTTRKSAAGGMRRPFGVAAKDITPYMSKRLDTDLEQEFSIPFFSCDKENFDQTLKRIITKEEGKNDNRNQSLFISLKLLNGDLKQVREENPHLVLGSVSVARKMGFPEVILPGDVRNDLYLTLTQGEFPKGNKTSDKNVEVTVTVCDSKGIAIPGVIFIGAGVKALDSYRSVIYYHEDKPHWNETFKVAIPIDEFKQSHIKFMFKHRSSNEAKDKGEKPFAMAYVNLLQKDGTTLKDAQHQLNVYKIDHKKYTDSIDYLELASRKSDDQSIILPVNGLVLSNKDSFTISTNICSTKLTQNVNLLGLLNWAAKVETLEEILTNFMLVEGEDIVKFLQDILDTLFSILMNNLVVTTYDKTVFDCLLHIISIVSTDWKYQHFEPVLNLYIKESFSATLAYMKLLNVSYELISNAEVAQKGVFKTMKCFQYIMRFISRSRQLYLELYDNGDGDEFTKSMDNLLDTLVSLMQHSSETLLREQGACLKYIPGTIPDVIKVYDAQKLSQKFCDILDRMPNNRLTKQKIMTMNEIVHSQLFQFTNCRNILLPNFTKKIRELLEQYEEVELCMKTLGDILDLLFHIEPHQTFQCITEIIKTDLRTVMQTYIRMDKESPYAKQLAAIMIDILRQMTHEHYDNYIRSFPTSDDVLEFLMEILLIFKELVNNSIFFKDWCEMIMLQNFVILKALRFFSHTIRDQFSDIFEQQVWNNFFHCAIAFMTQPALQLERFTSCKRLRIIKRYRDMRREMGFEIRSMWFNLGQYKRKFVPSLVENVLEMTLIPETELRKATIPIFFDMMQCEYYSSNLEFESFGDTIRNSKNVRGNFNEFEKEIISKLDSLIEGGRGDEQYKQLFHDIMLDMCSKHNSLREKGVTFVNVVTSLMERLLQYRSIINDENKENRMVCIVNLLDFYSEISRKEMYIRYVYKLYDLHLEYGNYTEAAYTLELHSKLLDWSNDILQPQLKSTRYIAQTHRQLKELLYNTVIDNFDKGEMWECALIRCKELVKQCEEETFDYLRLCELHKKMAEFYDNIIHKLRCEPEYFRVGYYGCGFPKFLQNKVYVYRGKAYERLSDFQSRMLNDFPQAELYQRLDIPTEEEKQSKRQYLQICKVDPVFEGSAKFSGKLLSEKIIAFYKYNQINKFQYSRPDSKKDPLMKTENEFAALWLKRTILITEHTLPHILRWFPVKSEETVELTPLQNALETMEKKNKELRSIFIRYNQDKTASVNSLGLSLNGILDASVMGGVVNYENTFLTNEYEAAHPEESSNVQKLKDLIAEQIPILELLVQIHKQRAPENLLPLHHHLEQCFAVMKAKVQEKYGKKTCDDLKLEISVLLRKQVSDESKTELASLPGYVGARSRVSSLTRAQVASFKSLTSSFNFSASSSPSSSLNNSISKQQSKSLLLSPTRSLGATPSSKKSKSKEKEKEKEKRRSSKTDSLFSSSNVTTQWYTSDTDCNVVTIVTRSSTPVNGTPILEMRQELTSKRPLRSEAEREKRFSRPSSGQFSNPSSLILPLRATSSSGTSSNRDSIGTTDSSVSEEDMPPPIPVKLRDADYNNLPTMSEDAANDEETEGNTTNLTVISCNLKETNDKPPTPPPKPSKKKHPVSKQ